MDIKAQLQTALEALVSALVNISANPKPNYSLDGQSVSWGEFFKMLTDGIKELNELIPIFDIVEVRSSFV